MGQWCKEVGNLVTIIVNGHKDSVDAFRLCRSRAYARGDGTRTQEEEEEMMTPIHVGPSRRGCQARMHDACEV
jgi:hypothetical protein